MKITTRGIAGNTAVQAVGKLVTVIISLVTLPIIARYLGPDLFGRYSLLLTIFYLIVAVSDLGVSTISIREASKDLDKVQVYSRATLLLKILSSTVFCTISFFLLLVIDNDKELLMGFTIVSILVMVQAIQSGLAVYNSATIKSYKISISEALSKIIWAFVIVIIISNDGVLSINKDSMLNLLLVVLLIGNCVGLLALLAMTRKKVLIVPIINKSLSIQLLKDSLPLAVIIVLSTINYRVDTLILAFLKGTYEVGIYNLSYRVLDMVLILPGIIMLSVFPLMSRFEKDIVKLKDLLERVIYFLIILALPIGVGIFLISPEIVQILGGGVYVESVMPLRLLAVAGIFSFINPIFAYVVILFNKQKQIVYVSLITVGMNIALNYVLIPVFSYNGAAGVTLFSELMGMIIMGYFAFQVVHVNLDIIKLMKIVFAVSIMVLAIVVVNGGMFVSIFVGMVSYATCVVILKILDTRIIYALLKNKEIWKKQ